ncbi:MAG: beta-propeller domain-containing protein [Candidatus Peribacteraceae bacterium]
MDRPLIRKFLTFLLPLGFFLLATVPVRATAFSDIQVTTPYRTAIETLKEKGIISGYGDGTFRPGAQVNRAEFLKIVLEGRGVFGTISISGCFPDVEKQWFARYVCQAESEGIVSGYPDGTFKPDKPISFVEAAKILSLAYKQQVRNEGGEWYVPYVEALESGKAIPPSINALERKVQRGEMAEMMWRLSEGKTDQPTKGLLNIKYPDAQVNFSSDVMQTAKSCADLRAVLSEAGSSKEKVYPRGRMMLEGAMPATAPLMMEQKAAETTAGGGSPDYSRTNVQVEGVDEGDIVKTDGTYLYVVTNGKVKIVRARPANDMNVVSTIGYKSGVTPKDLYVTGKSLIVLAESWRNETPYPVPMLQRSAYAPIRSSSTTEVYLYSLKDGKETEVRSLSFDGDLVSSRLTGGKLYLVLRSGPKWYGVLPLGVKEEDILPQFSDSKTGGKAVPVGRCGDVSILPHIPSPEFLTVAVVPAENPQGEVKKETMLGSAENVYASLKNLYVATTEWKYAWKAEEQGDSQENTNLFRFAFTGDGVQLASQGKVPGHILNQFSMDENGETFRIATTIQPSWSFGTDSETKSTNNLFVLDMDLKTLGSIEDIAPGESIYSVRFMGDRAYMVTFKQVDPLFVIDTSDPSSPKILGKLKIPGYSNYLHPYDATHIIGFGKEVDESIDKDKVHDPDAVYYTAIQGVKMALFDVSDVENPKELWKEVIGDRGSDSPLLTNHKALLFDKERGLLTFPILVTKRPAGADPSADGNPVFQGAYVYSLSLNDGFSLKGTITHYTNADEFNKAGDYWYGGTSDIQRILRIENSLVTISNDQVQSTSWPGIQVEGKVQLD